MINTSRSLKHCEGAATLLISVIMVSVITLIILFSASYGRMQQKMTANYYRNLQAFSAAEAGLEFGVPYIELNETAILGIPIGGFISLFSSALTANVALANNSHYTVVYTNPVANNYNLIKITSTGTSDDNTSSRVVSQLVYRQSFIATAPNSALITKGSVSLSGNANVNNTSSNSTITSGSSISFQGGSQTITGLGIGSSALLGLGSDVQQNDSTVANMSNDNLFMSYFGVSQSAFKNSVNNYYSNSSDTNYNSSLNGKQGVAIWIDQSSGQASLTSNTVVGSASNPVILIVNGNFRISGNAKVYGMVFVFGGADIDIDTTGNSNIVGALVTTGSLSLAGNTQIIYNPTALNNVANFLFYYAKVPGSWKDF